MSNPGVCVHRSKLNSPIVCHTLDVGRGKNKASRANCFTSYKSNRNMTANILSYAAEVYALWLNEKCAEQYSINSTSSETNVGKKMSQSFS